MASASSAVEQVCNFVEHVVICTRGAGPHTLSHYIISHCLPLSLFPLAQRNQDATCYVGGLEDRVDDELLFELFTQAGPLVSVHMPKDKITGLHQSYAFVEFRTEEDAEYASKIMNMTRLYGKPIRVSKASADKMRIADVGANLFIGNLAPECDEKTLFDTFSAFGGIVQPPSIMHDPETGVSKGFGFVNYDSFAAADLAIECMNGQFLANRQIVVQYAFKRESRGERHGSQAERLLAAAARRNTLRPHTLFATAPGQITSTVPATAGQSGGQYVGMSRAEAMPMLPPTAILPASLVPPQVVAQRQAPPPPPPLQQPMLQQFQTPQYSYQQQQQQQQPYAMMAPPPPPMLPPPSRLPGMMMGGGMPMPPPLPPPLMPPLAAPTMPGFQGAFPYPPPLPPPTRMI